MLNSTSFEDAVSLPDDQISLAEAALWIARDYSHEVEIEKYLALLDEFAGGVSIPPREGEGWSAGERAVALFAMNDHLFANLGFRGNREEYYDPRNSFLNEVLDRRTGIPITLALVYLEVGWRLGLPLVGIGLPGHFVVGWLSSAGPGAAGNSHSNAGSAGRLMDAGVVSAFVDVFDKGRILSTQDCQQKVSEVYGQPVQLDESWLQPVSRRAIMGRILNNLLTVFAHRGQSEELAFVLEKQLALNPEDVEVARSLGVLYAQSGHYWKALKNLERYVAERPEAPDAGAVRKLSQAIFEKVGR